MTTTTKVTLSDAFHSVEGYLKAKIEFSQLRLFTCDKRNEVFTYSFFMEDIQKNGMVIYRPHAVDVTDIFSVYIEIK